MGFHLLSPLMIALGICVFADPTQGKFSYGHEEPDKNFVPNWDCESPLDGTTSYSLRADVKRSRNKFHTGEFSFRVYNRQDSAGGIYHRMQFNPNFKTNTNYYLSYFIRQQNNATAGEYVRIRPFYKFFFGDGSNEANFAAILDHQVADGSWRHIGGDFKTPNRRFVYMEIHVRVEPSSVNYFVDTVSLTEIAAMPDWRTLLQRRIRQNRRSQVTLKVDLSSQAYRTGNTIIEIKHKKHEFLFGSAVPALAFIRNDTLSTNFRNFILKHFNWIGFISNLLWDDMEKVKGDLDYSTIDAAIELAHHNGMGVHGHSLLWNREENTPNWAKNLVGWQLKNELFRRIDYVTKHFRGKLLEWEVCNEQLHHRYYEKQTGDEDIHIKYFHRARAKDANVGLYLNDYEIVRNGRRTTAIVDQALTLKRRGAPIGGIGMDSHLRVVPIDPEVFVKRVQMLEAADMPVIATELSVHHHNVDIRATELEKALMTFFSESHVKGILLWGFSNMPSLRFTADSVLTIGNTFSPNKAGRKMLDLIHDQWTTNLNITAPSRSFEKRFRGYHGKYDLTVYRNGNVFHKQEFVVKSNSQPTIRLTA